jgi:flagellar hook-associated protein 2
MSIPSSTIASSLASSTGLNSGMDINGIITKLMAIESQPITSMQDRQKAIKQKMSAYSTIQGKVNDVLVAVKKLTARSFTGTTLFDGMSSTSSADSIATATVLAGSASQNIALEVKSLPTQTKASSLSQVGKFDNATTLSDLGITDGTFTMYVNGAAHTYTVAGTQTMGDLFTAINNDFPGPGTPTVPQITASIVDGKVSMAYSGGAATDIRFGSGSDTSNALAKLQLNTAVDNNTDTITASRVVTAFSTSMTLSGASAYLNTPVTDGTFSINGVSFNTTGKSLSTVMTEINSSAAAKVTASFNTASNRFELISKDSGSALINLADGTGNFLTSMGVINGSDVTSSQTSGKNAEFVLNGVTLYSTSTTVDENVTGLTGITLNLKQASPGTTTQITIQKDTASIVSAVKDVITKYNAAMTAMDQQTDTKNGGLLGSESRIKSFRNSLRSLFTSAVSGVSGAYDSLQQVGITTGAVGTGVSTSGSPQLQLDESKLTAALAADPTMVRKLFIGQDLTNALDGGAADDNMEGALTRVSHLLADQIYTDGAGGYGALYAGTTENDKGLFASFQASQQKLIDSLNQTIQKTQDRLAQKEERLRKQYAAMDQLVGQYQQQGTALNGLISQLYKS